tara:strand:- start:659 stop:1549 length:891 start_codon:yes stop_codon:yes gene_type:complete
MKITNHYSLPQPIVAAVEHDIYSKGEANASATDLIMPSRIFALQAEHQDEIEIDVSDCVSVLLGRTMHTILQHAERDAIPEMRLFSILNDWVISGQTDRLVYKDGILQDYKTCRVDAFGYKEKNNFTEWEEQLNIYAYLWRANYPNWQLKVLQVIVMFVDWSPTRYERSPVIYPPTSIISVNIPQWPQEKTAEWMRQRIESHKEALNNLPECTKEERWHSGENWAVKKTGRKTAVKKFYSESEATEWMYLQQDRSKMFIEHRPGFSRRCSSWCDVSRFCDQWQTEKLLTEANEAER